MEDEGQIQCIRGVVIALAIEAAAACIILLAWIAC